MVSEEFKSPNAIPPRTSSTGLNRNFTPPVKSVLRPLSESNWLAPPHKRSPSNSASMGSIQEEDYRIERRAWTTEKEKIVLGPYDYLYDKPGKDIRRQMIEAFNDWLKVPEDRLAIINKVIGMLHTASLLLVLPCLR